MADQIDQAVVLAAVAALGSAQKELHDAETRLVNNSALKDGAFVTLPIARLITSQLTPTFFTSGTCRRTHLLSGCSRRSGRMRRIYCHRRTAFGWGGRPFGRDVDRGVEISVGAVPTLGVATREAPAAPVLAGREPADGAALRRVPRIHEHDFDAVEVGFRQRFPAGLEWPNTRCLRARQRFAQTLHHGDSG